MLAFWKNTRSSFLSALAAGSLAYGFFLTNKLPNDDDLIYAFSKGVGLESGRFGLPLISHIFPDYSMPWINGLLGLFMLSLAMALLIDLFQIRRPIFRILLPAVMIVFPSQIGIFAYTFAVPAFALAFLLTVLSVRLAASGTLQGYLAGIASLAFVLSLYQAYLMLAAALLLLHLLKDSLESTIPMRDLLRRGIRYLLFLLAAMLLYGIVLILLFALSGSGLGKYASDAAAEQGYPLIRRVKSMLGAVLGAFIPGKLNYSLVVSDFSAILHLIGFALAGLSLILRFLKADRKEYPLSRLMFQLLIVIVLLPISVSCIFLLTYSAVHTLVLHAFVSIYLLWVILCGEAQEKEVPKAVSSCLLPLCLSLITVINVFAANEAALRLHYQNVYLESVCNQVMSQLQQRDDFTEDAALTFIGYPSETETIAKFDDLKIMGTHVISRKKYLNYYMGISFNYADQETHDRLAEDPRIKGMPSYPYYGYIQNIDGVICVKLGEE